MSSYYEKKKKGGMKFRISFLILFVLASFIVCFVLYMKSDAEFTPQSFTQTTTLADLPVSDITDDANQTQMTERTSTADINPIAQSEKLDDSYLDSCMFVGDSLMVGLGTYGIIPEAQVAASIGMSVMSINNTPLVNVDGSEILVADKIKEIAPENVYILLGLNMLGTYTDEQLLAAYGDFIDSIDNENINIYIISVPPVTEARENHEEKPILNSDIDRFNSDLLKFANNRCVYYIDLNTALKGADGRFPEEYAEADGIHFMKSTYRIMLDFLLTHVYSE